MSRGLQVTAVVGGAIVAGTVLVAIFQSDNVAAGLSALFAFGLLGVATIAARTGLADSRSRSRPMVGAELRRVPHAQGSQTLVIRNYGPSIARDIKVDFSPDFAEIPHGRDRNDATAAIVKRYKKPIAVMMPGTEWDNLYYAAQDEGGDKFGNALPHFDEITVTITYKGDDGRDYRDPFPLDVDLLLKRTFTTSADHPDEQALQNRNSLRRLTRATEKVAGVQGPEPRVTDRLETPDIFDR